MDMVVFSLGLTSYCHGFTEFRPSNELRVVNGHGSHFVSHMYIPRMIA